MKRSELKAFSQEIGDRHVETMEFVSQLDAAPADRQSSDYESDVLAEALFLRAFTSYASDVEKLFLHYVTGGLSLNGARAKSYLRVKDESLARKLTRAGWRFLSWAKPQDIRTTAETYMENGWPINDVMISRGQLLSDCERVRNRIAHDSLEARQQFDVVQRNLFQTERIFPLTPGQLLRVRNSKLKKLHIGHYLEAMTDTLNAIVDPTP